MLKVLTLIVIVFLGTILISPMLVYWWGLSNIASFPIPTSRQITVELEKKLWLQLKEVGEPKVKPISPYEYIFCIYCEANTGINSESCAEKYPGVKIAAQSIRKQIRGKLGTHPSNFKWQFTWIAYTVWVTKNWNTKEIISTYYDAYNKN